MKVFIGSDHAAFAAKEELKELLVNPNWFAKPVKVEVVDCGTFDDSACDYPRFVRAVVEHVQKEEGKGILLCGSGMGVCMAANRYANVRAAVCRLPSEAELSVKHNNSNILCLGSRISSSTEMEFIAHNWLTATFEGGRHAERVSHFNGLGEVL